MIQPGAPSYTAADVAEQKGHTSLSEELHKGKSKTRIRTQNPFEYISVSLNKRFGKSQYYHNFVLPTHLGENGIGN